VQSLASVDAGTQTDDEISMSGSRSPAKKNHSPMMKETEHVNDSDDDDDTDTPYDEHEHAEIETAVPVVARARVVSVQKPTPPALPPRNPNRVYSDSEKELNDGFDRVSLNGSTEHTSHDTGKISENHHEGDPADHSREEGHHSRDATTQSTDDDFHSMPTTPAEMREDIPGSFE
jgi:hypothetical protein